MLYSGEKLKEVTYSGWGQFEGGFVWSTSRYASLLIPIEKQENQFGIQMILEPFLVQDKINQQLVEVYCNGLFVMGHVSTKPDKEILFTEIHPSLSSFGSLKIDLIFQNAKSPKDFDMSQDMRNLAYKLYEFQILD